MPRISTENVVKFDRQTVTRENNTVDHGASAKANAKEAVKNVTDAFTPNHFKDSLNDSGFISSEAQIPHRHSNRR